MPKVRKYYRLIPVYPDDASHMPWYNVLIMNCSAIVIIGASTGGPRVLKDMMAQLPVIDACVVLVQHMPRHITNSVRNSLEKVSRMPVKLARNGQPLKSGEILLAPGDMHLEFQDNRSIRLTSGEKVNFVRPSIDVAMKSLKPQPVKQLIGIIMTGMGEDGVAGISHIKVLGGTTIAQDGLTCVVFGMPRAAVETGDVDFVLSPDRVVARITEMVQLVEV